MVAMRSKIGLVFTKNGFSVITNDDFLENTLGSVVRVLGAPLESVPDLFSEVEPIVCHNTNI